MGLSFRGHLASDQRFRDALGAVRPQVLCPGFTWRGAALGPRWRRRSLPHPGRCLGQEGGALLLAACWRQALPSHGALAPASQTQACRQVESGVAVCCLSRSFATTAMATAGGGAGARRKIGLVQMCSRNDKDSNFEECARLVEEAAAAGCQLVAFPENFSFMGARPGESQAAAEPLEGPTMRRYCDLAKRTGLWLSLGGFQEPPPGERPGEGEVLKIFNTHVIIDAEGRIIASYRKIHLFDAPFTGLVESKQAKPGSDVVWCDSPIGRLGVTICYDMRFPELYQRLRFDHGCEVLLMPSAFTMETGEAHWESLLRARAIECQCFVVAAAQAGRHNEDGNRRTSWGHSIAIDPWGRILEDMGGTETGLRVVELDRGVLESTRNRMPLISQRRYDLYGGDYATK